MKYTFPNRSVDIPQGRIIFMPKDISYDYVCSSDDPCDYILINFEAELSEPAFCSYNFDGFQYADEFTNNMADYWKFGGQAEHYRCYSIFYSLLAYIENLESLTYGDKKKSDIILPAVSHLKKHIYDSDLKIETLIGLCGISDTYFQQIFKANYGTTPQKYILSKRLSYAKIIIDNGDFDTISQVSALVGYNDPLYFSRAFKKKYGVSPMQYAKS